MEGATQVCNLVVVDDEPAVGRALVRVAREVGRCADIVVNAQHVSSLSAARRLSARAGAAWIVDQYLPDGRGTELLRELHASAPSGARLLLTGQPSVELACHAATFNTPLCAKPASSSVILALLRASAPGTSASPDPLRPQALCRLLSRALRLTRTETRVLRECCDRVPLIAQAHVLDMSTSTVRKHRSAILYKARLRGFADDNINELLFDAQRHFSATT